VLGGLVVLCLYWSWWLTVFSVLGIITAVAAKYLNKAKQAGLIVVLAILTLSALGYFGILPAVSRKIPSQESSCTTTITNKTLEKAHLDPGAKGILIPRTTDFVQRRMEVERDASRILFQARAAIGVDAAVTSVSRILDLESAPGLEETRRTVNSDAENIRKFLNDKNLSGREQRVKSAGALDEKVSGLMAQLKRTTSPDELAPIASALFEAETRSDMSQLAQKMFSLEEALRELTRQAVASSAVYEMESDGGPRATYRETITIRSLQDGLLDTIDASLLQREADSAGVGFKIRVQRGDGAPVEVKDPSNILIQPRQKTVKLIYDRFAPVALPRYCAIAPIGVISRVVLEWPPSGSSVRFGGVLLKGDEHLPVWFSFDRSKPETQVIEEIRMPANSVFATARQLEVSTRDDRDVLTSAHPADLALAGFSGEGTNWIEIFDDSPVLRNGVTRKFKDYLIVENSIAAMFSLVLSFGVVWIFPALKEDKH
jgi:hypothetical protein